MKTSHEFARELLALPDLPVWHFDPSFIDGEESPDALTEPEAEIVDGEPTIGDDGVEHPFVTINGTPCGEDPMGCASDILTELERSGDVSEERIQEIMDKLDREQDELETAKE